MSHVPPYPARRPVPVFLPVPRRLRQRHAAASRGASGDRRPAPAGGGGEPGLSRRDPRPPRAGAGLPHRRQGHPPAGGSRRAGKEGPAPGRTRSPGRAPATGGGAGPGQCRRGQLADRARRVPALPHLARPQPGQPFPVREHPEQLPRRRGAAEADPRRIQRRRQPGRLRRAALAPGWRDRQPARRGGPGGGGRTDGLQPGRRRRTRGADRPAGTQLRTFPHRPAGVGRTLVATRQTLRRAYPRALARGRSAIAYLRRPGGLRRPRDSGRTGPERAGLRRRRRGGAVIGSLVGADRRGRPGVRLGGRAGQLDPAPAGGAHRSLCRGPGAGARRPEGWRLGGGHRGPGASRRAAGASDRPGQPHGETGGQGVVACPSTFPPGRCRIARSSCT